LKLRCLRGVPTVLYTPYITGLQTIKKSWNCMEELISLPVIFNFGALEILG
jgi:hypothetical protein